MKHKEKKKCMEIKYKVKKPQPDGKLYLSAESLGRPAGAKGIDLGTGRSLWISSIDAAKIAALTATRVTVVDAVTPPCGAPPEDFPESRDYSAHVRAEVERCIRFIEWVRDDEVAEEVSIRHLDDIHGELIATPVEWIPPKNNDPELGEKANDFRWSFHPQQENRILVFEDKATKNISFDEAREKGILV